MLQVAIQKQVGAFKLDVAFQHEGGTLILFGPSGSGKTTTLRNIAGLDRPTSGHITFDGEALYDRSKRINMRVQQRRLGFIFQQPSLFPHMTARENIAYAGGKTSDAERWIELFGVQHIVDQHPNQMSGGEQQRITIIRALMRQPRCLLMDEPMSAVDAGTRHLLLHELHALQRETKIPMIYVTHNVSEAYRIGDRVIVMEGGRIVQDGLPIEVFHTPTSAAIASLSGTENIITGRVLSHNAEDHTTTIDAQGATLHVPLCHEKIGKSTTLAVRPEDILLATGEVSGTSARNQVAGRVVKVRYDTFPTVLVALDTGLSLRAKLTHQSVKFLKIEPGRRVYLLMKTWAFHPLDAGRSHHHTPDPLKDTPTNDNAMRRP